MKIKRKVGRFVLIENNEFTSPIAIYVKSLNLIAVCFGGKDCIHASMELNHSIIQSKFMNKC